MAIETRRLSLLPQQLIGIKEGMNVTDGNANVYGTPIGYGGVPLMSGTTTETFVPVYGSGMMDSVPAKNYCAVKAESGVSYNLPVSRKRTRDAINPLLSLPNNQNMNYLNPYTFIGEDMSLQIQYQQLEIDQLIAQHTEKVRLELEERRKGNSRRIIQAVEAAIVKRLRSKDEEIERMAKLNSALEDKVKSLYIENQIWRDLAQSNEATANALRSNLEQILSNVEDDKFHGGGDNAGLDAESCCGSNYEDEESGGLREGMSSRLCRNCGKVESCVLLLPCRHLCLCTVCGSSLHTCPVCKSTKNASVHVNMYSS